MRIPYLFFTLLFVTGADCWFWNHHGEKKCLQKEIPPECNVKLYEEEHHEHCIRKRNEEVQRSRQWYKITNDDEEVKTDFPLPQIPFLNQDVKTTTLHYQTDPDEGRYTMLFLTLREAIPRQFSKSLVKRFSNASFNSFESYKTLMNLFAGASKQLNVPQYLDNPAAHSDFTDQINTDAWKTDEAFTQRRLAGRCPFMMRKVTRSSNVGMNIRTLSKLLNKAKLNKDVNIKIGYGKTMTMKQAIDDGRLFVLYNEDMDGLPTNVHRKPADGQVIRNLTSPISLYVLRKDGLLHVFAIQMDSKPESAVYTPNSNHLDWDLAKSQVVLAEHMMCQAKHHMGGVHYGYTVFCLAYRRHFSRQHPLYDFFKFHCEGTTPHISLSHQVLMLPGQFSDGFTSWGSNGYLKLAEKTFNERIYGDYDYHVIIKKSGLDDARIKYHPFRDDALLILEEIKRFANEFVKLYYSGCREHSIVKDSELQSFANEISIDGKNRPDGGKGKFIGFPSRFTSKKQLKQFIVRFIWYNVIHTVANYPAAPYFLPISPFSLFENKNGPVTKWEEIFGKDPTNSVITVGVLTFLSDFRANVFMDYFDKTQDKRYGKIVRRSHHRLHSCIQKTLEKRNKERKQRNQLGYQFLEPKWITNSVHS